MPNGKSYEKAYFKKIDREGSYPDSIGAISIQRELTPAAASKVTGS